MEARTLCEHGLRVALGVLDGRGVLMVAGEKEVGFFLDGGDLEAVLRGAPIQLSAEGLYCLLEREEDSVRLTFGEDGSGTKRCKLAVAELADALLWLENWEGP